MSLSYLILQGDAYEQGWTHGQVLAEAVAHNLELYFQRFEREGRLSPREARARGEAYLGALRSYSPTYVQGLEGLAAGSKQPLLDLATLNVRYEILYHQFAHEGCTAFSCLRPEGSWLGQNWDWIAGVKGAVLHLQGPDGEVLSFTEAGIFGGKIGLNAHGLGLCINGLVSAHDDWSRLGPPFHLRTDQILQASSLEEALAYAMAMPRSGSANFLIAQEDRAIDLEVAPFATFRWDERCFVHANHFLEPSANPERSRFEELARSLHRHQRLAHLLEGELTLSDLQRALSDRKGAPYAICRSPSPEELEEGLPYQTVTSVIMDLRAKELWISDGPPDRNPYVRYTLRHGPDSDRSGRSHGV
jgi:isopenicillin-N N-acyltransferase-like protein